MANKKRLISHRRASDGATVHAGRVDTWAETLGCLPDERAEHAGLTGREIALAFQRGSNFTPDDFAHKRSARERMTDALTRAADRMEAGEEVDARDGVVDANGTVIRPKRPKTFARLCVERARINEVRRRLEWELWP